MCNGRFLCAEYFGVVGIELTTEETGGYETLTFLLRADGDDRVIEPLVKVCMLAGNTRTDGCEGFLGHVKSMLYSDGDKNALNMNRCKISNKKRTDEGQGEWKTEN